MEELTSLTGFGFTCAAAPAFRAAIYSAQSIPIHQENYTVITSFGSQFVKSTRGVCGGVRCVARTRIPLWVLHRAWKAGKSDVQLRRMYPSLKWVPLRQLREYVELHSDDLDREYAGNQR
jgi:uncharacterized protein (DUF433 family)